MAHAVEPSASTPEFAPLIRLPDSPRACANALVSETSAGYGVAPVPEGYDVRVWLTGRLAVAAGVYCVAGTVRNTTPRGTGSK